jgi:hypothetical protein
MAPELYVVTGMHKSGTTLVADVLQQSGVSMVESYDPGSGYDSGRFTERPSVRRINSELLARSLDGRIRARLPAELAVDDPVRVRMREVLAGSHRGSGPWGFKDPRLCLTYHLWQPLLPGHRIVAVYRHPAQVMRRFRRPPTSRVPVSRPGRARSGLRQWLRYNRRLLEMLAAGSVPSILLRYEELMEGDSEFTRLERFLDRPLVDARDERLYRHRVGSGRMPTEAFGLAGRAQELLEGLDALRRNQM